MSSIIQLEDLPQYSPWVARILGLEPGNWHIPPDYEERYFPLLAAYHADPTLTPLDLKQLEMAEPQKIVAMSVGEKLYRTRWLTAQRYSDALVLEHVVRKQRGQQATVVDLGCGWGYFLTLLRKRMPAKAIRGLDISQSGIILARDLHVYHGAEVARYDLASGAHCEVLDETPGPLVVLSVFTCHQLYSAAPVIDLLARWKKKIIAVVQLEPEEEHFGEGLLGMLRKKYSLTRNYSADTYSVLSARDDITFDTLRPAVIGAQALLPGSLLVWRFHE